LPRPGSSSAQVSFAFAIGWFVYFQTSRDERGGAMGVITQLLETTAVLIPDFQVLSASVFFSLYCCASSLGFFSGPNGVELGLPLLPAPRLCDHRRSQRCEFPVLSVSANSYQCTMASAVLSEYGLYSQACNDAAPPLELQPLISAHSAKQPDTRDSGVRFSG